MKQIIQTQFLTLFFALLAYNTHAQTERTGVRGKSPEPPKVTSADATVQSKLSSRTSRRDYSTTTASQTTRTIAAKPVVAPVAKPKPAEPVNVILRAPQPITNRKVEANTAK